MLQLDQIYHGNCAKVLNHLKPDCVDLTVTSPPYDNLREYNGYLFDFKRIAAQLWRVTKQGGVVVWIVNDQTIDGSETGSSFRQALYFKEIGFNLHDTMIWLKHGGGAVGSNFSYKQNFEYMFVLSKGRPKTTNLIHDVLNGRYEPDGSALTNSVGRRQKDGSHKVENRRPHKPFSKRNNWWYVPVAFLSGHGHPAVFPDQLARDHIESWSADGDLVLDPMCGSGTTCKAAKDYGRHFIGIDCSKEYCQIAANRVGNQHFWSMASK